ncbi:hypothetical protein B0T14DRAFT_458356 [Immersiella caudata]|uniref:Nephrocystin 3-like N-terminal domain-containing protein n=1 Tax=Immersiella caudata TaxID=314043 RepID=A0AA39WIR2_9PEZI|nr:hypothetical protein B0T14DRAFT_458356 [Immersiella caudata]
MPKKRSRSSSMSCLGIRVVYTPPKSRPAVDIVLVHGLQGHAIKTWTAKNHPHGASEGTFTDSQSTSTIENDGPAGATKRSLKALWGSSSLRRSHRSAETRLDNGDLNSSGLGQAQEEPSTATSRTTDREETPSRLFWPKDLLPRECPEARVATWGYDTKVSRFGGGATNKNTVFSHAKDFLHDLERFAVPGRPFLFVAHSFGGIVVKEMLALSDASDQPGLDSIVGRTVGVVFLGTPHRGSVEMAKLGNKARMLVSAALIDTSSATLDTLGLRTSDLERCQDAFSRLWAKHDFQVKTFQEGLGLSGFNIGPLRGKVVPDFSSLLGDSREQAETLHANHRDMCRFTGPDDPNARKLLGWLRQMYLSLLRVKGELLRPLRDRILSSNSTLHPGFEDLGGTIKACLQSFRFPGMDKRRQTIQPPFPGTCHWLPGHPAFQAWRHGAPGADGLIWICGKPGCGKSVLMRDTIHRFPLEDQEEDVCLSYFFDAKGTALQNSNEGAYRSMLWQLFTRLRRSDYLERAVAQYIEKQGIQFPGDGEPEAISWTEPELKLMFRRLMQHQRCGKRLWIFIDALDACSYESQRDLVMFLQSLARSTETKVCLSARKIPPISSLSDSLITMHQHTGPDIVHYVHNQLIGSSETKEEQSIPARMAAVAAIIIEMSEGVFLWVVLVVDMVLRYLDQGRNLKFILEQLREVPDDLNVLYREILLSHPQSRSVTARLFYWACLGGELRIRDWRDIMPFLRTPPPKSLAAFQDSDHYAETDDQLEKQIRHISMGLIEVAQPGHSMPGFEPNKSRSIEDDVSTAGRSSNIAGAGSMDPEIGESRIVQVIHISVRDFFSKHNGFAVLGPSFSITDGYISILHTCLDYIAVSELDDLVAAREKTRPSRMPDRALEDSAGQDGEDGGSEYLQQIWDSLSLSGKTQLTDSESSAGSFCSASSLLYSRSLKSEGAVPEPATHRHVSSPSPTSSRPTIPSPHRIHQASSPRQIPSLRQTPSTHQSHSPIQSIYRPRTPSPGRGPSPPCNDAPHSIAVTESINGSASESSWALESRVLETHPALLSYVTTTFFQHFGSALQYSRDLTPICERMESGMWKRWSALHGDIPGDMSFTEWLRRKRLTTYYANIVEDLSGVEHSPIE